MNRFSLVFWITCCAICITLIPSVVTHIPLYLDANLRNQVITAIERLRVERGFLFSGISIREVSRNELKVHARTHLRGEDPVECYLIDLNSNQTSPCED